MGTVVFLHKEEHKKFSEVEEKMAAVAAEISGQTDGTVKKYFKK